MKSNNELNQGISEFIGKTLEPVGWLQSFREGLPVRKDGKPLPWWTYPAIEFISTTLRPDFRVYEYGGGHSTLWWAQRVSKVISVDHDEAWVNRIAPQLPAPHRMSCIASGQDFTDGTRKIADNYFASMPGSGFSYDSDRTTARGLNDTDFIAYAGSITEYDDKFDCIVIDGMARRLCAWYAVEKLEENGIIIFDNSNRSDYMEGYQHLIDNGFKQIRLWGNVAGAAFPSCTSVFIRNLDSLPTAAYQSSIFGIPEY